VRVGDAEQAHHDRIGHIVSCCFGTAPVCENLFVRAVAGVR